MAKNQSMKQNGKRWGVNVSFKLSEKEIWLKTTQRRGVGGKTINELRFPTHHKGACFLYALTTLKAKTLTKMQRGIIPRARKTIPANVSEVEMKIAVKIPDPIVAASVSRKLINAKHVPTSSSATSFVNRERSAVTANASKDADIPKRKRRGVFTVKPVAINAIAFIRDPTRIHASSDGSKSLSSSGYTPRSWSAFTAYIKLM